MVCVRRVWSEGKSNEGNPIFIYREYVLLLELPKKREMRVIGGGAYITLQV